MSEYELKFMAETITIIGIWWPLSPLIRTYVQYCVRCGAIFALCAHGS